MRIFPPIPAWDGMHPLVVHFPVALLLVAPLLVLLGLIFFKNRVPYWVSAWALMVLGTIGAFVAVSTGEAGAQLVDRTPEISKTLEQHQNLAETTRTVFTILTAVFAALLFAPIVNRKEFGKAIVRIVGAVFLIGYLGGMLLLVNTAHAGGTMVHEYGVRAMLTGG